MKKKKTEAVKLIKISACPTRERMNQDGGIYWDPVDRNSDDEVIEERARAKITCKLDWYLNAGTITAEMWKAGSMFAFLHFLAGKLPRTTPMYGDFVSGRRGHDPFASKTDSQIRLEQAMAALIGPEKDVIWDVCGNDLYAGTPARTRALVTGLRALVTLWRLHDFKQ